MSKAIILLVLILVLCGSCTAQMMNFTIANGASLSGAVDMRTCTAARIIMPAAWTTANLTFQLSSDGVTYNDLYDEFGNEITVVVAANRTVRLAPGEWWVLRFLKLRSGTAAGAVTQAAERTIKILCR